MWRPPSWPITTPLGAQGFSPPVSIVIDHLFKACYSNYLPRENYYYALSSTW